MRLLFFFSLMLVIAAGCVWLDNRIALERCLEDHSQDSCNYALR